MRRLKVLRHDTGRAARAAGVVAVAGVISALVAAVPGSAATSNPGKVGLTTAYTLNNCGSHRHSVDPINVVWGGGGALPGNVGGLLAQWGGWTHNDYQSPFGADSQWVTERGGCFRDDTQRADDCAICNRNHVRLFSTVAGSRLYVVGDAHHDSTASVFSGCGQALVAGHYASSFDAPRDVIARFWRRHEPVDYRWWGNTRRLKQCNGSMPHSNGWVLFAHTPVAHSARVGFHPTNVSRPAILGNPVVGNTLSVNPGQWSVNATSFVYSWCYADPSTNSCTAIPGANAATWIPQPSDVGKDVAVLVRPVGSGPIDAVSSAPVRITSAAPVNLTPPQIIVPPQPTSFTVPTLDPGTWSGNPTFTYVNGTCTTDAQCASLGIQQTASPVFVPDNPNYGLGSLGYCGPGHYEATVIATNAAGELIQPVRSADVQVGCIYLT